ncbi:hypothetical protein EYF80_037923 [Liparis tanakae]|uniref:Uncharacterized protein n=1 Tax=Liparis tanakae TaxID=230148 RepID=A0A4Z2GEG1_9TELE|nr:hypothetical protein EYF80_037923 [Liparis tanakae]
MPTESSLDHATCFRTTRLTGSELRLQQRSVLMQKGLLESDLTDRSAVAIRPCTATPVSLRLSLTSSQSRDILGSETGLIGSYAGRQRPRLRSGCFHRPTVAFALLPYELITQGVSVTASVSSCSPVFLLSANTHLLGD